MTWEANLIIVNNTLNNITMVHDTLGEISVIAANQSYSWSTEESNNSLSFKFWTDPNMYFLTSVFNFGPDQVSFINRGTLPQESQDIKLTVSANSVTIFEQYNGLGGMNFLSDLFKDGETITWTYDSFSTPLPLQMNAEDL